MLAAQSTGCAHSSHSIIGPLGARRDELRAALLGGASLADLLPQMGILAIFALVGLPLSLAAFCWAVRRARVTGSLSHF